jgi:hypothetical protein
MCVKEKTLDTPGGLHIRERACYDQRFSCSLLLDFYMAKAIWEQNLVLFQPFLLNNDLQP